MQVSGLNVQILLSNFVFGVRMIVTVGVIVGVVVSVVVSMAVIVTVIVTMIVTMIVSVIVSVGVIMCVAVTMGVIVRVTITMVMVAAFATQVVMSSLARVQNLNLDEVEDQGKHSDNKHLVADNLRWCEEAHSSLSKKPNRHDPNGCDRDHCSNNFSTVPSICQMIAHASLSQPQRDNRDGEPNDV